MRMGAVETARRFVDQYFPHCLAAVLGGGVSESGHNPHSDLDIVILEDGEIDSYRRVVKAHHWIIECFVLTLSTYRDMFDEGIRLANPSLQRMIAGGIVIHCGPQGSLIIEEARSDLADGPMPWSSYELDYARYTITDYLEDLRGSSKRSETWFVANKLVILLSEFLLRANHRWIGEGKHLYRCLSEYSPELAQQLEEAMEALYCNEDRKPLDLLCVELLQPHGGLLLDGYEG